MKVNFFLLLYARVYFGQSFYLSYARGYFGLFVKAKAFFFFMLVGI